MKPMMEITTPQPMTRPRSAPSRMVTARMPGVGGTMAWVRFRPVWVKAAILPMEMCFRLERTLAMLEVRMVVMSPNTGMETMYAVRAGASSRFLPRNSRIKKLAMDFAAPVSCTPMARMAPSMMGIPMLPRVLPKPLLMRARTSPMEKPSGSKKPMTTPIIRAVINREKVGCSLNFMISAISRAMARISIGRGDTGAALP